MISILMDDSCRGRVSDKIEVSSDDFNVIIRVETYGDCRYHEIRADQAAKIGQALIDYSKKVKFK